LGSDSRSALLAACGKGDPRGALFALRVAVAVHAEKPDQPRQRQSVDDKREHDRRAGQEDDEIALGKRRARRRHQRNRQRRGHRHRSAQSRPPDEKNSARIAKPFALADPA
jgi:hypothetical protein